VGEPAQPAAAVPEAPGAPSAWIGRIAQIVRSSAAVWVSLAAALVATWPLAAHLTSRVPLGTEHEATVPVFSLWNLWWTADRLPHAFEGFLDAPFFYPNKGVTTYSEPMPLLGSVVSPFWHLGATPALTYNLALLIVLTLNGVFAYRLGRVLGAAVAPALLGSVLTATLPFAADVLGVLPNLALFGMLWTLEGLVRFGRSGSVGAAIWAAAGFGATFYAFEQYALFFAPFALAAAIVALSLQGFRRRQALGLAASAAVAALAILPLALPTIRVHDDAGFQRPSQQVKALSANVGDFLTRPETAAVHVPRPDSADTAGLFPGFLLIALAVAALIGAVRERGRGRWTVYLAAGAVLAFLLALGLNLDLAGWRPFATLRAVVPGYDEIRSPYRFAAVFDVFLVVLGTMALARLWGSTRASRVAAALVVLLGLVAAAENLSLPAPLLHVASSPRTAWSAWLGARPPGVVVAHVPFPAGLGVADYEVESWRLFAQIDHHKQIVNGYSGYFPVSRTPDGRVVPSYSYFQLAMAHDFPSYRLLCVLSDGLSVDLVVADRSWLRTNERRLVAFPGFLQRAYADPAVVVYRLRTPAGGCRPRAPA
jgi:hypothetical protein